MTVPMIPTRINGRWDLLLPDHRAARPEWVTGWEPERLDSMHEHLMRLVREAPGGDDNQRPVIIDVGVEEGDLTALYSQWGCDVVMVEPNPRVWPNVRVIWQANELRPPLACWVGFAGDVTRTADMPAAWVFAAEAQDDGWPACAHGPVIGDHAFLHLAQHAHMVPTRRLDDLVDRCDAITMDVEGSELSVLRGAERLLREHRPLVWVSVHTDAQWMDENYPLDGRDAVVSFMDDHGYAAALLAIDHEEHWLFTPKERP